MSFLESHRAGLQAGPNKIPFLAGQDWLLMMKAVIDIGANEVEFKALGVRVPLHVDTSGHLTVAIDEFPVGGWPPGLETRIDHYPGAVFVTAKTALDDKGKDPIAASSAYEKCDKQITGCPNYMYEPNDDNMNTNIPRGPCSVQPDFWEFDYVHGIIVRHHRRPRKELFDLATCPDGPFCEQLMSDRITVVNGLDKPLCDTWLRHASSKSSLKSSWTGCTYFFLLGTDLKKIKAPTSQRIGVEMVSSADGKTYTVHPSSLTLLQNKKILQFDLGGKAPIFEHVGTKKQVTFDVPPQQFGSKIVQSRKSTSRDAPSQAPSSMAASGLQDDDVDGHRSSVGQQQRYDSGAQAPWSSTDGLHGEHPQRREAGEPNSSNVATFDDSSSGSDQEGNHNRLPDALHQLPPRAGVGTSTGQLPREVPGMHSMRVGEEGLQGGLRAADHLRESHDLRHHPRTSRPSRRQDSSSHPRSRGFLNQIGSLLLALIAFSCGSPHQQGGQDEAHQIGDLFGGAYQLDEGVFPRLGEGERHLLGRGHVDGEPAEEGCFKMKKGWKKRVQHQAHKALAMSKASLRCLRRFGYDIVEIFGGSSMISIRAVKGWNLRVLQPVDIRYGVDLYRRSSRRWLLKKLEQWNPRLAVVEFPCTPWSILQRNVNYLHDPDGLEILRDFDRPLLKLTNLIFEGQRRRHGHALAENPATADSHQEPEILELRKKYYETTSCMCQFGMVGKKGGPMLKRVRWIGTHPIFIQHLDRQCPGLHQHEKVEGSNTALSAEYPPDLADTIVRAYLEVTRLEDFGLAHDWQVLETRNVYYVPPNKEEANWRPLLEQALEILSRKVQGNIFLDPGTDLYKKVLELVPWQISCVQIAHLPKAKRVRPGLEQCHRCSVLLQNDDRILIETEHLPSAQAPRERFVAPVKVAIFILGYAPGEPQGPSPVAPPPRQVVPEAEVVQDPMEQPLAEAFAEQGLVRQDFAKGECWFIGAPLSQEQKRMAPSLVRLHRNLGHPRNEDFVRALVQSDKIEAEAIALARRLRCATCERTRRPLPPSPTSLKAMGAFNDRLCLDFVFLHDIKGEKRNYLHILDPAGGFNVFAWIASRKPDDVFDTFTTVWASWAGYPRSLWTDRDGSFEAEFEEKMQRLNVEKDSTAAEAHWQAGEVEAYNRAFRYVAERLIDEHQFAGESSMKQLGAMVGAAMNDKVRTSGASANQWVFGKNPRMPEDLLSPDGKIDAIRGLDQDEQLRLRNYVRATADALLSQYRTDEALRAAVNRIGRPSRKNYEAGELVAFWRDVKRRKGKLLKPGWFRGTIVGPHKGTEEGSQSNYWVTSSGKLILVSKEQLRPTFGTERWAIQEDDLQGIADNVPDEYHHEVGDGPPSDQEILADGVNVPLFDDNASAYTPSIRPSGEEPDGVAASAPHSMISDTTQPQGELSTRTPALPDLQLPDAAADFDLEVREPAVSHSLEQPQAEQPEPKRPRLEELDEPTADAAPSSSVLEVRNDTWLKHFDFEASSIPEEKVVSNYFPRFCFLTRKEQKALDKEIPWHMIPADQQEGYAEALVKEWGTWCKYEATRPLDLAASAFVEENVDKKRILDTRVCYRNKNAAYPWLPVKHKARIVCRGDRDPDITVLRRDAPTMTRLSLMVLLQVAASKSNWFLFNADITGAFLQGDQKLASRKEALYLRQPREGLPGLVRGQLLLVVRGIFGLANSPRLFWRHLRDSLIRLGFVQSTLDRAVFFYYKAEKLILALGAHVDDLIGTGEPGEADYVLDELKKTFDFGAWADTRTDEVLEYGGKQIRKHSDGRITLTQEKFVRAATLSPIPK